PILRNWQLADYGEQRALIDPMSSLQAKSWQSFEKFVASSRCVKSDVIEEDELTTISEVHAGARLNGDIQFKNHNLSAGSESPNEIHQYKQRQKSISQVTYEEERKKFALENDFFIIYTTAENCNIELPKRSGIVDGKKKFLGNILDHLQAEHTSPLWQSPCPLSAIKSRISMPLLTGIFTE
ncbi:6678_t:CDS:2, partial [Acaulospora morrowiae]